MFDVRNQNKKKLNNCDTECSCHYFQCYVRWQCRDVVALCASESIWIPLCSSHILHLSLCHSTTSPEKVEIYLQKYVHLHHNNESKNFSKFLFFGAWRWLAWQWRAGQLNKWSRGTVSAQKNSTNRNVSYTDSGVQRFVINTCVECY